MAKKNDNDILINILLDRSGSMQGLAKDVIGQFNQYIESQRHEPGKAQVSLVLFDDQYEEVYTGLDINEVPELDRTTYFVRGWTAYVDALAKLIKTVDGIKNKPKKIVFVVNTDGYENSSREYTVDQLQAMIKERQENHDWQFVFLGAGIDALRAGTSIGVRANSTLSFDATSDAYAAASFNLASVTSSYRSGNLHAMEFVVPEEKDKNLQERLADYKKKKSTGTTVTNVVNK